jgi:hypothetical protein
LSTRQPPGWLIRATGSPADLRRIAEGLGGGDLHVSVDGDSLYLTSPDIDKIDRQAAAEWAAYELIRLISAAANILFGTMVLVRFQSVRPNANAISCGREFQRNGNRVGNEHSLLQAVIVAQRRPDLRTALLACAAGGADGLFRAYEALCSELMSTSHLDYAGGIGTREWLTKQGWVDEQEEQQFLDTVVHFGRQNGSPSFKTSSPCEAQHLVEKLLSKWIDHVSQPA